MYDLKANKYYNIELVFVQPNEVKTKMSDASKAINDTPVARIKSIYNLGRFSDADPDNKVPTLTMSSCTFSKV